MSSYYILSLDSRRDDLEAVDDYKLGEFDVTTFWNGEVFSGAIPAELKIELSEGHPADLLGNPMSWLIVSHRMREEIEPLCQEHVQFIQLTVWRRSLPSNDYWLANPIGCIDAINSKEKLPNIQTLKVNPAKIPTDRHLFRLKRLETIFVISHVLFEVLRGKGFAGIAAIRVS